MAECLEIVFRSFWTFIGTLLIVSAIAQGIGGLVRITFKR